MLKAPLTEPRRVVSLSDPAMKQIGRQQRVAYSLNRNIEELGDISTLKNQFTIAVIHPMRPESRHLATRPHLLFAANCSAIENGPTSESDFETTSGMISLKVDSLTKLPFESVIEWGGVVLDLASVDGVDSPFLSPVTSWEERIVNAERIAAIHAAKEFAKQPPSKP